MKQCTDYAADSYSFTAAFRTTPSVYFGQCKKKNARLRGTVLCWYMQYLIAIRFKDKYCIRGCQEDHRLVMQILFIWYGEGLNN